MLYRLRGLSSFYNIILYSTGLCDKILEKPFQQTDLNLFSNVQNVDVRTAELCVLFVRRDFLTTKMLLQQLKHNIKVS